MSSVNPRRCLIGMLIALAMLLGRPLSAFSEDQPAPSGPPPEAAWEGTAIQRLDIVIAECPWCPSATAALARDLIVLRAHEPFSAVRYQQSITALELSGRFEEIRPTVALLPEGLVVAFDLKPARVIRDIRIDGAYPLFESDILKAMSIYPGDDYHPEDLPAQEALISDLYTREGYIIPVVTVTDIPDTVSGTDIITVHIKPGPCYVLDDLTISGNRALTTAEIKSRMDVWRSSFFIRDSARFRESSLTQDVKNLTSLYWQRRYPECEIRPTITKNAKRARVDVDLAIAEGPRYEVSLTGNRHFRAFTLKKDIVLFQEGNRRDRGLRQSIETIKRRYRLAGYLFTEVQVVEEKITVRDRTTRRLELAVTEGPRTLVRSLAFTGNTAFDAAALQKDLQTRPRFGKVAYVPDLLDDDLAVLQARYLQAGYTDVQITPEVIWSQDKTAVNITVRIVEGVKTTVRTLTLPDLKSVSADEARKVLQLKEGQPFRAALLKPDETALANRISDTGHPYASVTASSAFTPDRSGVDLIYQVAEGPAVRMGNIYYGGNLKTRPRVLHRELGIKPGDPFSLTTLLKGQRNIRDMGIFDSVQFKTMGLKEQQDHVTLLVDMEETPPYYLQSGIGYTSDSGLYGNARVGDRNLFGLNKDVWLEGEVSQIGYNGELDLTQRRIFGSPITSTTAVSYERAEELNQTFGTSVWTASESLVREFAPRHLKTTLGFRYERREQFPQDSSTDTDDTYAPRGIFVTTPGIAYDTRDSFVRPTKGVYTSLAVDVSRGLQNSLDNFLKYTFLLRGYWSPASRLTLAGTGRVGYIDPFGTESTVPEDQLLYLGGTYSVRGFDENMLRYDADDNAVGGLLALSGSLEARLEITRTWEATLFYDAGALRKPLTEAGSDAVRSSVGIGLRYVTPIGPMGLLYGRKINPREGESSGRVHFSIGYTF